MTTGATGTLVTVDFRNPLDTTLDGEGAWMLVEPEGERAGLPAGGAARFGGFRVGGGDSAG